MADFIRFGCGNCGSKMKVPGAFAGKKVKCPGCQQAVAVPAKAAAAGGEESSLSAMDLSMLGDEEAATGAAAKPRRIRDLVIGCGACGKNVKIPENRCGSVARCPKCDAALRVDCPPPPPGSGKTVDFRHVTLDPVEEAALDGADGSLAGSLAGLSSAGSMSGGTAAGRAGAGGGGASGGFELNLEDAGGSSAGGAAGGRDQMAELRTLNDLLAEGSISKDEYKKRRSEVMQGGSATGSAARAATSRAVGGVGDKRAKKRFRIPGPVKAIAVLAVLGGLGWAGWAFGWPLLQPYLEEQGTLVEEDPAAASTGGDAVAVVDPDAVEDPADAEPVVPPAILMVTPGVPVQPWEAPVAKAEELAREAEEVEASGAGDEGVRATLVRRAGEAQQDVLDATGAAAGGLDAAAEEAEEATRTALARVGGAVGATGPGASLGLSEPAEVTLWPVMFPEARSTFSLAAESARTMRMARPAGEADIGVVVGPPAPAGVEDPALVGFYLELRRTLLNGISPSQFADSTIENYGDRARRIGPFDAARMTEVRGRSAETRSEVTVLVVAPQAGRAVAYWFTGNSRLRSEFEREALGTAVIE